MKHTYFQILKDLIQIPSPSGSEQELARHIVANYCQNGWVAQMDDIHNILFCPKDDNKTEKLPLLYAHLDTHPRCQPSNESLRQEDVVWLNNAGNIEKAEEIQLGFDDKAGVAAILYLMLHTKLRFRVLLVVQEEVSDLPKRFGRNGGGGIDYAIKSFSWVFGKSAYLLSLDRANGFDIIDVYGVEEDEERPRKRMCSEKFRDWVIECSSNVTHTLQVAKGSIADIYNIKSSFPNLNCVNLSIGYYYEHTEKECLKIDETIGVISVVQSFIAEN
jgi:putative aminopeptidase FrvX